MSNMSRIVHRPLTSIPAEQARDTRARAWAYVFECFNRHVGNEGGPATAPDNDAKESKNDSAVTQHYT